MSATLPACVIRLYRRSDLEELQRITVESFSAVSLDGILETQFGVWNDCDWKARKAAQIAHDCAINPQGVFVAEAEDVIVGYVTTVLNPQTQMGRIPNLAVCEASRGAGLGRKLIEHALAYFRAAGMRIAQIETMGSNPIGQHLYPACGFVEVARQVHYAMRL